MHIIINIRFKREDKKKARQSCKNIDGSGIIFMPVLSLEIIIKMDRQEVGRIGENSKSLFESRVSQRLSSSIQPRGMEQMNLLIIQKISDVVASYYENIDKLRTYYSQIESLVDFNKRLIRILNEFEAQEQKLIKRLRRMQQVNVEYMREYCQMKGRQFKMPNLPEHKSIFANYSLQQIEFSMKTVPPVLEVKYKDDLISILKQTFLTRQDQLLNNIQLQLQKKGDQVKEDGKVLLQICRLIKQYHWEMGEFMDTKPFDLLKKRSIIRKKVEQFYDSSRNQSEIKPNYLQQDQMVNKVTNLQAKVEDISFKTLQNFLLQEKELCNSVEMERIELKEALRQKQKEQEKLNKVRESEMKKLQEDKNQMLIQFNRVRSALQEEMNDLKTCLVEKELRIQQIENLVAVKNYENESVENELSKLKMKYTRLQRKIKNPQTNPNVYLKLVSEVISIVIEPSPLDAQRKTESQQVELEQKQRYMASLAALEEEQRKQLLKMGDRLALLRQENDKINQDKLLVENLAIQVCQAIRLVASMSFNQTIKQKLETVQARLEQFLQKYQRVFEWDISKQSPGYFTNLSLANIRPSHDPNHSYQMGDVPNPAYSFDASHLPILKENLNAMGSVLAKQYADVKQQNSKKNESKRSLGFSKSIDIIIPQIQGSKVHSSGLKSESQSLSASKIHRMMSLQLPNENEEKNDRDEFENLRRLYQQSVQCLEMEEKKTKSMQSQYQKYVEMIIAKQKSDPDKFNLEKQLVYLTRLSIEQQETIEEERKTYNQIFKEYHESFKSEFSQRLNSLRGNSNPMRAMSQSNKSVL